MIVFPLRIRERRSGTLAFYFHARRVFGPLDIQIGTALASIAAAALSNAELYDEQRVGRDAADYARQRATFLAEAGTILNASLDYERTLAAVAALAVPTIADWCAVDILGARGTLHRRRRRACESGEGGVRPGTGAALPRRSPRAGRDPSRHSDRTTRAHVPDSGGAARGGGAGRRAPSHAPRISPHVVHVRADAGQGKAFGAITFVSAESGREYTDADLRFAGEIAARASIAVENARLYARAMETNRLKDEFLATLSHELRTPLNAVLGYTRMLRHGALTPEQTQPALEVVERNATALTQIIADVLDVSRIVAGQLRLNVETVDLPAVLREACAAVIPAADAKGIRLESIIDPLAATVSGDPDRLQQIVWNLLSNAIKFTPRGGRVQLRLARINSHVEIVVSDTGQGIAADFLPFVFDRFRQADATFTREHGGLGLGLAIARQLARSSTGGPCTRPATARPRYHVHVQAAAHDRAALRRSVRQAAILEVDRAAPRFHDAPRLDRVHVLAVDDEPDSLQLLRSVLESVGARVTIMGSGRSPSRIGTGPS